MISRKVKNLYHSLSSLFWTLVCGFPSSKLTVIGVTGTDGKTTTCHLIYETLKESGIKVALISTVAAYVGDTQHDTGYHVTSPDAATLQPMLKKIVDQGYTHLVLEVTSHGLDQNRFIGIAFKIGVLTNVSHEHLDYHQTFDNYRSSKAKLFRNVKFAVLNRDDPSYDYFKEVTLGTVVPYSKSDMKIVASSLLGGYNLYNIAAAEAVAKIFGVQKNILKVVSNFKGVPGRREEINLGQKYRVIIDFAHTPNALESVLKQLRSEIPKNKKMILVFGCAGLRDRTKRSLMGKIARRLADKVIVTAEDPRSESLDDIFSDITEGSAFFMREDDRQKAIDLAVSMVEAGDTIVLTGKGHEKSMCFGKNEYPWSEVDAVKRAILG